MSLTTKPFCETLSRKGSFFEVKESGRVAQHTVSTDLNLIKLTLLLERVGAGRVAS